MGKPTANLRLFAAIHPPLDVAKSLVDAITALDLPLHRPTPIQQVHMTVQFIGDTPSAALDATIESVQRAAAGLRSFPLTPHRLISLPQRGAARLVAAELEPHPTLLELHRRLVTRLAKNVRPDQAGRFRPHMTLCRFQSPARNVVLDEPVHCAPFAVQQISLMRSTLTNDGAMHREVIACVLDD